MQRAAWEGASGGHNIRNGEQLYHGTCQVSWAYVYPLAAHVWIHCSPGWLLHVTIEAKAFAICTLYSLFHLFFTKNTKSDEFMARWPRAH